MSFIFDLRNPLKESLDQILQIVTNYLAFDLCKGRERTKQLNSL